MRSLSAPLLYALISSPRQPLGCGIFNLFFRDRKAHKRRTAAASCLRAPKSCFAVPGLQLCRFSDAGMTGPSTRRGGRRPKSAKARNRGRERQRCRGHYGDLAAGSGAREWRRGGRQTCFAWLKERDLKRDRAVRVVGAAIVGFWVVIAQATGAATRTSALSAQSQRRCRARMEGSSSSAGIMRYRA
jgi:hypothetical protein